MPKKNSVPAFPKVIETFADPTYQLSNLRSYGPSCWNGVVSVRKYRVTAELIDEPVETIHNRLQEMWDHCHNPYHRAPLKAAAKQYGLVLVGGPGNKRGGA